MQPTSLASCSHGMERQKHAAEDEPARIHDGSARRKAGGSKGEIHIDPRGRSKNQPRATEREK
eukprot:4579577-Amphidinium_carterae.1